MHLHSGSILHSSIIRQKISQQQKQIKSQNNSNRQSPSSHSHISSLSNGSSASSSKSKQKFELNIKKLIDKKLFESTESRTERYVTNSSKNSLLGSHNSNYYNSDYKNKNEKNIFTLHDYGNNTSLSSRHLFLKKEINSYQQKQINPMNTPNSNKYMKNNIQYSANIQQPRHKSFLRDIPVQHVTPYFVDNNYSGCNNNYYKQNEMKNNNENFKQNTSISAF